MYVSKQHKLMHKLEAKLIRIILILKIKSVYINIWFGFNIFLGGLWDTYS